MAAVSFATGVNLTSRARLQTQRKHRVTSSVRCAAVQPSKQQQQQRRPQHHYHHRHAAVAVGVVDDARRHRVMSGGRGEQLKTCASSVEAVFPGEYEHQTSGKSQLFKAIAVGVGVAALALAFPCASLAAAKAKGGAVVAAAGPIPFLPFTHNQILHAVNLGSLPAWISLVFLPRWRHTKTITLAIAVAYSVMYVMLAYVLFSKALFAIDPMAFSTTEGLSRMFAESTSVLAGWAHFIVFDLWTARYFVLDSGRANIPHLAVVPCILGCMFFGPLGLLTYVTVKKVFELLNNRDPLSTKTFNF